MSVTESGPTSATDGGSNDVAKPDDVGLDDVGADDGPATDGGVGPNLIVEPDGDHKPAEASTVKELLEESRQAVQLGLTELPSEAGIYAIYADDQAWADLGLQGDRGPGLLYVGLTLGGLDHRVVQTHFSNRKTPWSIVRRTLAGLLQPMLDLEVAEESVAGHRHFGLVPKSDRALSKWMRAHLQVGFWQSPKLAELQSMERILLEQGQPPLAPHDSPSSERIRMESARLRMVGIDEPEGAVQYDSEQPGADVAGDESGPSLPLPLAALLDGLDRSEPLLSLTQKKPTWVTHRDELTLHLQTTPPTDSASKSSALAVSALGEAYETLITTKSLARVDLVGSAKRRSAFVLALLSGLDGVEVAHGPVRLTFEES